MSCDSHLQQEKSIDLMPVNQLGSKIKISEAYCLCNLTNPWFRGVPSAFTDFSHLSKNLDLPLNMLIQAMLYIL